jgi:hypothetical protein
MGVLLRALLIAEWALEFECADPEKGASDAANSERADTGPGNKAVADDDTDIAVDDKDANGAGVMT